MPLLFFAFLFVLVLLGDGKQPNGDVVAAGGILGLFLWGRTKGRIALRIPPVLNTVWATLLLYFVGRTVFSDSVGYSISTTIRWVMAYLVFVFFSSTGLLDSSRGNQEEKVFFNSVLIFGVVAVVASFIAIFVEPWGSSFSGMNLLYPTFGHNHVVDVIVFAFPLVLYRLIQNKNTTNALLLLLFGLALVFSFARGAWLLMFVYLLYCFRTKRVVVTGLLVACAAAFLFVTFSKNLSGGPFDWPTLKRQLVKASALENRLPYWKQAVAAVGERPLFGAGPGTFYLLSKRLQETPKSYSWYAHSFPLELLAEIGIIGTIGVMGVIGYTLRGVRRRPLFHSVALTLAYSLYEFNLNFLVIWLLLWATLGLLYGGKKTRLGTNRFILIPLTVLGLFYLSSVLAALFGLLPLTKSIAFFFEPYVETRAVARLETASVPGAVGQLEQRVILFFHKKDPEVLIAMARKMGTAELFRRAVAADPQNVEYIADFIDYLVERKNAEDLGRMLSEAYVRHSPRESLPLLSRANFSGSQLLPLYTKQLMEDIGRPTNKRDFLAKTYYFLGYELLEKSPETTRVLWTLARDTAPEWGYFHVELASLEYQTFRDPEGAESILNYCHEFKYAAGQCGNTKIIDTNPGDQHENIKAIPTVFGK